jgi:hypothetical protein
MFYLDPSLQEVSTGSGFEVFATADAPGATLADAGFLQRLALVSEAFEAKHLFASFHAGRLVMLIHHKGNYFEMSHRQETDFARDAGRLQDQLSRLFAIIELLQLRGALDEGEAPAGPVERPEFPELGPKPRNATDRYYIGGWGCLHIFVVFAVTMSAYLWVLDPELSKGLLLWWAGFGGLITAWGLFLASRGMTQRSTGRIIFGVLFLLGAFAVLYYNVPYDARAVIQSWVPGL